MNVELIDNYGLPITALVVVVGILIYMGRWFMRIFEQTLKKQGDNLDLYYQSIKNINDSIAGLKGTLERDMQIMKNEKAIKQLKQQTYNIKLSKDLQNIKEDTNIIREISQKIFNKLN